jgi:hypothetical protein
MPDITACHLNLHTKVAIRSNRLLTRPLPSLHATIEAVSQYLENQYMEFLTILQPDATIFFF